MENLGKDPFPRHDAVAHLVVDGAMGVALLADLGQFQHHVVADEARADGEAFQVEALDDDVLAERPMAHFGAAVLECLDLLVGQKAHLAVPRRSVGVALDAQLGLSSMTACSVFWIPLISLVHTALITPMMHLSRWRWVVRHSRPTRCIGLGPRPAARR